MSSFAASILEYLEDKVRGEISNSLAKSGPYSTLHVVLRTGSLSHQTALSKLLHKAFPY